MAGELSNTQVAAGLLSADATGRALLASNFFTATELGTMFASGARPATQRGAAMMNRLNMGTVPAAGETVTIGADVYEFRADTPPSGGTAGRIWVYEGGGVVATARTNLANAINNTVDAPNITYNGAVTEAFVASVVGNDVLLISTGAVGSATPVASGTATACTDTLGAALDIWDQATCYGGRVETARSLGSATVTLNAQQILQGYVRVNFPFTPTGVMVINRSRPHNETVTIVGQAMNLALSGGVSPNNQAGDVIDIIAWGA